jgi:hypothetical protein
MDRRDELPDSDETGIQAEGRIILEPAEIPAPTAPSTFARESPRSLRRRILAALIPWISVPSMCLGFGSVYFQFMTVTHVSRSTDRFREESQLALWMAVTAIPLGFLGYWLSRHEMVRIEKEVVFPRGRPVTIQSRWWSLIGLVSGILGVFVWMVIRNLS